MEVLTGLYEGYLGQVAEAAKALPRGAGIFGTGGGLADAPCHDAFLANLERFLTERAETADSGEARALLEEIYRAPIRYEEAPKAAYWVLFAAHGLTEPLIRRLNAQDARELARWYEKTFPRRERLPVQNRLLKALGKQK